MTTSPIERPSGSDPERAVLEEAAQILEAALDPAEESALDHLDSRRRIVFVHAHPDDETTATGVTMAKYAAEGAHVTLVTCTRGEEGEVVAPGLEALHSSADDRLGEHRVSELATALEALGVTDSRFLAGPGTYRDSGMAGTSTNEHPHAFARADVDEAAARLVEVLRDVRPQVLVTYDARGGYGHPDHVMAHRVATRAVELSADPAHGTGVPWQVDKVYESAIPERRFREGMRRMVDAGVDLGGFDADAAAAEMTLPDELVTTVIDGTAHLDAKVAAWRAHASQVGEDFFFLRMPADLAREAFGLEFYRCVRGQPVPDPADPEGRETDLFAGVRLA
jgi:N-acetyl-1-D-myo-inositol-2-amino-2-deoxy-alpha-D-glucopyranoside deacetylase